MAFLSMKRILVIFGILLLGGLFYFLCYDLLIYPVWVDIVSPHPSTLDLNGPRQLTDVPPNEYYHLAWSEDGDSINLYQSNWSSSTPDLPSNIFTVDVVTGKVLDIAQEVPRNSTNLTFNLRNAIKLETNDKAQWIRCLENDVVIKIEQIDSEKHVLSLYQNGKLSITLTFAPVHPGGPDLSNYQSVDFMAFAPQCNYLALTLEGWERYEGFSRDELWLLDVAHHSLNPIVIGRWPAIRTWDYPVQGIHPDWSPDGKILVFGDQEFGLETYNIETSTRSRLASLNYSGWDSKWSPSGEWIAAEQWLDEDVSIMVLSKDGKFFSSAGKCNYFSGFEWSPVTDELAFLCNDHDTDTDTLWIWDVKTPE